MNRFLSWLLVALLTLPSIGLAADAKITALTATTTPASTDIVPIVIDPSGTPLNRKVTVGNLFNVGNTLLTTAPIVTKTVGVTSADGLVLQNTTAAAAGAQQYSPRLHFIGQGWKTNSTAASQAVDWIVENQPVQGTANPTTSLAFASSVNGGAYTNQLILSNGAVPVGVGANLGFVALSGTQLAFATASDNSFNSVVSRTGFMVSSGSFYAFNGNAQAAGTTAGDLFLGRSAAGILALSGNATGAALQCTEMTAPVAGAANTGRIYCEDNGSGKTRLMIQFASGAAQQIAIEP